MAFREVSVVQVREALRRWLNGDGERPIARGVGIDRKTARRYITAAVELGVDRDGGEEQLTDELIGQVVERVRPHRLDGHGEAWRALLAEEDRIKAWVERGPHGRQDRHPARPPRCRRPAPDVGPFRGGTVRGGPADRRRCGWTTRRRVSSCRSTSAASGLIPDGEQKRVCQALIFTACFSRHLFVWPTFTQTTEDVIAGFEAAWLYFAGVFPVVIPDNMALDRGEGREHRAPVQRRVLRVRPVPGFRHRCGPGGDPDRQAARRADRALCAQQLLCRRDLHRPGRLPGPGTAVVHRDRRACASTARTQCRPIEAFRTEELPRLLCLPGAPFDVPTWSEPKVHRDFHVEVDKALYSAPHRLIGRGSRPGGTRRR